MMAGGAWGNSTDASQRRPPKSFFFLDTLESRDHAFDGMQPVHPQLSTTDHVHYTCVAGAAVPTKFARWPWEWWQCRSYHDKAHAALVVAMTAARLRTV